MIVEERFPQRDVVAPFKSQVPDRISYLLFYYSEDPFYKDFLRVQVI